MIVWVCLSLYGVGQIHRILGVMDRSVYTDILSNVLVSYLFEKRSISYIFQHDNDSKHTSKLIEFWFLTEKVEERSFLLKKKIIIKYLNYFVQLYFFLNSKKNKSFFNFKIKFSKIPTIMANTVHSKRSLSSFQIENLFYPCKHVLILKDNLSKGQTGLRSFLLKDLILNAIIIGISELSSIFSSLET